MLSGNPQVIFTEADPQTDATFLSEVKQLHGMLPVIGTETSLQAPWLKAVGGAIGTDNLSKYVIGMQPLAPATGAAWKVYNKALLAVEIRPESLAVVDRPLLDDLLRRRQPDGTGDAEGEIDHTKLSTRRRSSG